MLLVSFQSSSELLVRCDFRRRLRWRPGNRARIDIGSQVLEPEVADLCESRESCQADSSGVLSLGLFALCHNLGSLYGNLRSQKFCDVGSETLGQEVSPSG